MVFAQGRNYPIQNFLRKAQIEMKIILVRPNYSTYNISPPLGLGYLASYLKNHGIETKIIDALRENLTRDALIERILREQPDAVGITCFTAFYREAVELAEGIKKNNIRCIMGGVHPTVLPRKTLIDSGADYVICGEGEIPLLKLMRNGFDNTGIRGVYSMGELANSEEEIEMAETIENLDEIPFPDWEQINPNLYPKSPHGMIAKKFPVGNILTTRGCPYRCTFCASPKRCARKIRLRTPQNVIEEIRYLTEHFGVKEIHFEDDNLTFKQDHAREICNLIIKSRIKISWSAPNGIRADKINEGLAELMAKSGCYCLAYGIESADPKILQNIKKDIKLSVVEKAIKIADSKGILCVGYFILGLPGETKETMERSIRFAKDSGLSRAQFAIFDVLPGSELWEELKGEFKPDWTKKAAKEPEWVPKGLTNKDLLEAQTRAFRTFYLRPKIIFRLMRFVQWKQIGHIFRMLKEYRLVKI